MTEFKKLAQDLLLEREGTFSKCSTQCNIEKGKNSFLKLGQLIKDEDLHEYGRENEYHTTVLYGINPSLNAFNCTKAAIEESGINEIKAVLGDCSIFENDKEGFDVIKFEVISEDLYRMNEFLCNRLDYTNDYPYYKPHVTIAYVKRGLGQPYADKIGSKFAGFPLSFDKIMFSDTTGDKKPIILGYPGNETAQHPNTGNELEEDFGYGGSHLSGGVAGNAYMSGHLGVYNSPEVQRNAFKSNYDMMNNNTVQASGYYDTVFDDDIRKVMAILKDLGFEVEWPNNDDGNEFHLQNTKRHDQTHTHSDQTDIGSSDDVLHNYSGINLSKEVIMKHLRGAFGNDLESMAKEANGKITYDEIMMGMKEVMRDLKYPDKDYALIRVLKTLIKDPKYYSGLGKYDIHESVERNIYGTKFKPNVIKNILKEIR